MQHDFSRWCFPQRRADLGSHGVDSEERGKIAGMKARFASFHRWYSRALEEAHVSQGTSQGRAPLWEEGKADRDTHGAGRGLVDIFSVNFGLEGSSHNLSFIPHHGQVRIT